MWNMTVSAAHARLPTFVENRLPQIREACRRYYVRHLYLYGSAVTDQYRPTESDLDFMVDFLPEARSRYDGPLRHRLRGMPNASPYPANYRALASALEELFSDCTAASDGPPRIDIGTYGCINNEYFKRLVDAQKVELYAIP